MEEMAELIGRNSKIKFRRDEEVRGRELGSKFGNGVQTVLTTGISNSSKK